MVKHPIRVAMLGGGLNSAVGQTHEIAMKLDNLFSLVAGCFSRNQEINTETGRRFLVAPSRVYHCLDSMLFAERGQVDAVIIATPITSHASQIARILDEDLVVICDKPLIANIEQCRELVARVSPESTKVYSIYNYTGYQAIREIKHRISAGDIGNVFKIMAEMPQDSFLRLKNTDKVSSIQEWRLLDGEIPCVSLDLFVHLHSLIYFLTGSNPLSVVASSRAISGVSSGLIDEVDALIHYENDLTVNAWYGKAALGCRNGLRIRVFGTRGSFDWVQEQPEVIGYADAVGDRYQIDRITSSSTVTPLPRYNRFKAGHPAGFIEAFANYYFDIARSMRDGSLNEYTLPVRVAIQGIQLSKAIHDASILRREVTLT